MSLDLDQRQRAMLEEMHVRVWSPVGAPAVDCPLVTVHPVLVQGRSGFDRLRPDAGPLPAQPVSAQPGARPQVTAMATTPPVVIQRAPQGALSEVAAMDWPTLARTVGTCGACKLCVGRKAPVFIPESAARQADWLVVGEPPDELEERAGSPFAGPSGELLDNMLRAVCLTRGGTGSSGARLTNVVKCRPAAVRNPQADELAACAAYLRREIALVRPRVILAMGRFAALSLLGTGNPQLASLPFGKLRGQVYRFEGVPVVVTHHPTRLLRAREDKAGAWADLCLAQSTAARQDPG